MKKVTEEWYSELLKTAISEIVIDDPEEENINYHNAPGYWSSICDIRKSVRFLSKNKPDAKILDIGSGIGKFCIIGAYLNPEAKFIGIELDPSRIEVANLCKNKLGLTNVDFIQGDFTKLQYTDSLKHCDGIYIFNPFDMGKTFYENQIDKYRRILRKKRIDISKYEERSQIYFNQYLERMPSKTKLVANCVGSKIPPEYKMFDFYGGDSRYDSVVFYKKNQFK